MDAFGDPLPGVEDYEFGSEIGHGRFSEIYSGKKRSTGEDVAIKYLPKSQQDGGLPKAVVREVQALQQLQGEPNIINYHGMYENEFGTSIVLDAMKTDLRTYMLSEEFKTKSLQEGWLAKMLIQMLQAIDQCHKHGIIHRDISPSNFLIGDNDVLVLADFGISLKDESTGTPGMGTLWYMSPEVLFGTRTYRTSSDVWSFACIAAEMVLGRPLFKGQGQIDQICQFIDILGVPNESTWPELQNLPDWGKFEFSSTTSPPGLNAILEQTNVPNCSPIIKCITSILVYNPNDRKTCTECIKTLKLL